MTKILIAPEKWKNIAEQILTLAKARGADQAEAAMGGNQGFSVNVRLGEVDTIEYHQDKAVEIAVYFNQQMGAASTTDINAEALENAVNAACSIAKATSKDACHGLADKSLMAKNYPDLDVFYPWSVTVQQAVDIAKRCENAGREYSKKIVNSEGVSVNQHEGFHLYANTQDFIGSYFSSRHSINCILLGQSSQSQPQERDYEYTIARDPTDLLPPEIIGRQAAEKTLVRLNAQKLPTQKTAVIFAPRTACGLLGHFVSAVSGTNIYRQASFLAGYRGKNEKIFPECITIEENPHILKALGSVPFDAEGVNTQSRLFIEKGYLKNYILSSYSARKLGLETTGNAGGVHNLQINPTAGNLKSLMAQMNKGLLITEVMGQGVNIVTGDYSRGASGFWIENGEIQYPVHEITIAGNLKNMFLDLQAAGSDIDKRGNIWSGSLLFDNMTIAGK